VICKLAVRQIIGVAIIIVFVALIDSNLKMAYRTALTSFSFTIGFEPLRARAGAFPPAFITVPLIKFLCFQQVINLSYPVNSTKSRNLLRRVI
jgi:hypothetical protein